MSVMGPQPERMGPVPGNKYVHHNGTRHCGNADPCPTKTGKCPCGQAVEAELKAEARAAAAAAAEPVATEPIVERWSA